MNSFRPISTSLSPNTEKDDIDLALKLIFQPSQWQKQGESGSPPAGVELEEEFKKYLGVKNAFSFNSGRSALLAILEALEVGEGKEVLLQAFTCNAAVNPILERRAEPVFVDVDDTINMDPEDLKKKITSRSKAIMVQHNFGWPAKVDEIFEICKKYNLCLIEDAAHALGAKFKGKLCGTFGDTAFFSLGRDKIISSVFGGIAVTNSDKLAQKIKEFQEKTDYPSNFWIFQQLLHPILIHFVAMPAYGLSLNLGKIFLGLSHKLSILSKAVYKREKRGKIPKYFPKRFPNALAHLALNQFRKLERFNKHRREIADFYQKELKNTNFILPLSKPQEDVIPTFMRYPILVNFDNPANSLSTLSKIERVDTDEILRKARKRKIYLDDGWRKSPVVPSDTNIEKMKYKLGSCPRAEKVAQTIVNLPTHINISKKDAQKIVNFLKQL